MNTRENDLLTLAEMNASNAYRHEVDCRILELENEALQEEIQYLRAALEAAEQSHESLTAAVIAENV